MSDEEVVVVTGGSGFLGQHIVKHLLEQNQFPIREVRVFDLLPLKWVYGLNVSDTAIPLHQYQGDICNPADLQEALAGATVVIHNASIVDVSANPDIEKIQRVNVNGTENVIKSCLKNNVEKLVYTSTITVVDSLKTLGVYGITKRRAEDLILGTNGQILSNGKSLQSCALRPAGIYGEGHPLVEFLKPTIWGQTMVRLGGDESVLPYAYAGNIAGAFVAAIHRLRSTSSDESELPSPAGMAISLADDTPLVSNSRFSEPFALKLFGAKPSRLCVPFWFMLVVAHVLEWISYLMKPFIRINFPFIISRLGVVSQYGFPIPCADENIRYLGYEPLYSYETAFAKSVDYYQYYIRTTKK